MKNKYLWIILVSFTLVAVGAYVYLKFPDSNKDCSEYTSRDSCKKNDKCHWPGPSCAIPGKNCGVAYNPNLDKCLPKEE